MWFHGLDVCACDWKVASPNPIHTGFPAGPLRKTLTPSFTRDADPGLAINVCHFGQVPSK